MFHGYIALENINLSTNQRRLLLDTIWLLSNQYNDSPSKVNHIRPRPDKEAMIFEAEFSKGDLTVSKFKNRLANILNIDASAINFLITSETYNTNPSRVVIFNRRWVDYFKVIIFGGIDATWEESGNECRAYLSRYKGLWEGEGVPFKITGMTMPMMNFLGKKVPFSSKWTWEKIIQPVYRRFRRI